MAEGCIKPCLKKGIKYQPVFLEISVLMWFNKERLSDLCLQNFDFIRSTKISDMFNNHDMKEWNMMLFMIALSLIVMLEWNILFNEECLFCSFGNL